MLLGWGKTSNTSLWEHHPLTKEYIPIKPTERVWKPPFTLRLNARKHNLGSETRSDARLGCVHRWDLDTHTSTSSPSLVLLWARNKWKSAQTSTYESSDPTNRSAWLDTLSKCSGDLVIPHCEASEDATGSGEGGGELVGANCYHSHPHEESHGEGCNDEVQA